MSQTWVDSSMSTSFSPSSLLCKSFNKKQSWKNFAVNTPIPLSRFYHSYFILPALSWIYPSLSLCPSYPLPFNLQLSVLRLAAVHPPPFLASPWHMEFLGQGSDSSCDLSCRGRNAESFTRCARLGIEPASQCSQDATNPVAPQWELLQDIFNPSLSSICCPVTLVNPVALLYFPL